MLTTTVNQVIIKSKGYKRVIIIKKLKVKAVISSWWKSISELQGVGCHMGSYSITCHPTQANTPRLNHSQWMLVLNLPTPDGWKAEFTYVAGYIPRWFTRSQTVTHPSINSRSTLQFKVSQVDRFVCKLFLLNILIKLYSKCKKHRAWVAAVGVVGGWRHTSTVLVAGRRWRHVAFTWCEATPPLLDAPPSRITWRDWHLQHL